MRYLSTLILALSSYGAVDFEKDIKPIFEKNSHLREKGGSMVLTLRTPISRMC